MELCLYIKPRELASVAEACVHPLPCPEHGSRIEPVAVALEGYAWRVDPLATGGKLVTLLRGNDVVQTRIVSAAAGEAGDEVAVRMSILGDAGLMPRRLAGRPLIGVLG